MKLKLTLAIYNCTRPFVVILNVTFLIKIIHSILNNINIGPSVLFPICFKLLENKMLPKIGDNNTHVLITADFE